jgi:hypothetical protein
MLANTHANERWRSFVDSQIWEAGYLDQSSYFAFLRAGSLGVDPQEALTTVAARINGSGGRLRPGKLNQQLHRAYAFASSSLKTRRSYQLRKEPRPTFVPDYALKFAERAPTDINQTWLRRLSPIKDPYLLTPAEFLAVAYKIDDRVLIFSDYRSQGQILWQKYSYMVDPDALNPFVRGHADGVWMLANPVDGKEHFNQRQKK